MSFYSMMFGKNAQAEMLLAVIGLREHEVPRFRDVHASGSTIDVYTRMGGGNRGHWDSYDDEPGETCPCAGCRATWVLGRHPLYVTDEDDDYDSTYATYTFRVPEEFVQDVANLSDPLAHGLRAEFAQHIAKTLRREPTDGDKEAAAYKQEQEAIARLAGEKANGHTFVPYSDSAMEAAVKLAEANGGKLRSCWGILPLRVIVKTDTVDWPGAQDEKTRTAITRARIGTEWKIDRPYWEHCASRYSADYPLTMGVMAEAVAGYLTKEAA